MGISDKDKIRKLRDYFKKCEDIVMAFLFGSYAKKRAHAGSDWDIAVYFKPVVERVEWEEQNREYLEEDKVWHDCMDILKTDNVDLVVLNRAPASIAETASDGLPLIVKDWNLWRRFRRIVTQEAEDYRSFVSDFFAISERSISLTPRDAEDLRRTIGFLEEQLGLYRIYRGMKHNEYEEEVRRRNEVERWVENIINATIDIGKIILGSKKRLIPSTYREAVGSTVRVLNLSEDFSEKFERWVKLRNILAHEYLDIKWKRINNFISESEPYFRSFLEAAKKFLEENPMP